MKEKIWTRGFTALNVSNTFVTLGVYMLTPVIPLYLVELGATETQVGVVGTAFFAASIITRLFINMATKLIGKKPTLLAGILLTAVVIALYGLTETVASAAALRIAQGIGFGVTSTLFTTFAADMLPDSRRGEGVGYFGMGMMLARAFAPAISLYLMETYSFNIMFYVAACFPILSVAGMRFFMKSPDLKEAPRESAEKTPFWRDIYDPRLTFQAIMLIMYGICRSADMNYISLFAQERKLKYLALFFVIQTMTAFCVRFVVGRLTDRKGRNWTLIPGGCATLVSLLILSAANSSALLLLAAFFSGISVGVLVPAMQLWMFSLVAPEKRGVASATYFNFFDVGVSLGALMLGYIVEKLGYSVMFLSAAAFAVLYLMCYLAGGVERRSEKANASSIKR